MFGEVRKRIGGLNEQQQAYLDAIRAGQPEQEAMKSAGYKSAPRSETLKRAISGEKVGDYTEAAKNYAFRLAVERISGDPLADDQFDTWAMRRGRELEPEARDMHAFQKGLRIQRAGFVLSDDNLFGASADGLIGNDGGSEYKCLVNPERLRDILLTQDLSEFMEQVQGCMWLTGRTWWHFCLYCPALASIGKALTVFHVDRDDDFIEAMEVDLIAFAGLVSEYESKLRAPSDLQAAA
jgi:hypothetical protein